MFICLYLFLCDCINPSEGSGYSLLESERSGLPASGDEPPCLHGVESLMKSFNQVFVVWKEFELDQSLFYCLVWV